MPLTVFYSWQSDADPKTNHRFLKSCLEDSLKIIAADGLLEEVARGDDLHLDHDTKGVFGDVEVLNTILNKIDTCDLFVADITIVAKTAKGKQCPNPNVLLELGYAIQAAGPSRTLKVLNQHYGSTGDGLPFDMAHKRFPYCYTLAPDASKEAWDNVKKQVTRDLAEIIGGMFREVGPKECPPLVFKGVEPVWKSSSFIKGDLLGRDDRSAFGDSPTNVYWNNGPQWFLRLIPYTGTTEMTTKVILDLLNTRQLPPLGKSSGGLIMANTDGGVCYEVATGSNPTRYVTQLFRNGEIWGIEQPTLHAQENKFIPFAVLLTSLCDGLRKYLDFMRNHLKLEPPIQIIAGLSGVKDFKIAERRFGLQPYGNCPIDEVLSDPLVITSYDITVDELLGSFFQKVWEEFALTGGWRPDA